MEKKGGNDLEVNASVCCFFIGLFPAGFARVFCLKKKQIVSLGCVAAQLADFVKGDQYNGIMCAG